MSTSKSPRRKPGYPGSLTDLHRFRKTVHGHDGSSRIVMVRKTDQRTFASIKNGQEPKLETITRETIETFRGQRTECKITTEKKDLENKFPEDLAEVLSQKVKKTSRNGTLRRKDPVMEFQNECLKTHNEYRAKHGVPPLKLNKEICRVAQNWANTISKRGTLEHSKNRDYGENIFCMSSTNPNFTVTGDMPVKSWYDEIKLHKFGQEPNSLASGHFTQVVWKESKELGVAFAKNGGRVVVVANYYPPGNFIGSFAENVPPLGGFASNNNNDIVNTEKLSKLTLSSKTTSKKNLTDGTEGDFEEDFLKAHNEYRKRHGVPPLKLDKKLCKFSEEWAKNLASRNIMEHRKNSPYGENIFCMHSSDPNFTINGHMPVDTWYEEISLHPFGREPNSLKSGHFTQVVWKSSELLGVGVAKSRQGYIYVVANYSPAGNFVGHFAENVPPLVSDKEIKQAQEKCTTQTATSNTSSDFTKFQQDALKAHNEYRRRHEAPDLKLNKELCDFAQEWADQCARTGNMAHRLNNPYGENIFSVYSCDFSHVPSAKEAVKHWYDEFRYHNFGSESINSRTLHFTQVIWNGSRELGIGISNNHHGKTYIVANYNPRGNIVGQFVANVNKPNCIGSTMRLSTT